MPTPHPATYFAAALCLALTASARANYTAHDLTPPTLTTGGQPLYTNGQATAAAFSTTGAQAGFASHGLGINPPDHALLWSGSAASFVDMNPSTASSSDIYALTPTVQVGQATTGTTQQAGFWTGTPNSFTPLPSTGFTAPEAHAAADTPTGPVLAGYDSTSERALLWTKITPSTYAVTNLHTSLSPLGSYDSSFARATDGLNVAGQAFTTATATAGHAIVWNVASHAASDLNGSFDNSDARSIAGTQVAGYADNGDLAHAILWTFNGSTYLPADLNPLAASTSQAYATNGTDIAGFAVVDDSGNPHAYLWLPSTGSTFTTIDLQTTLSSNFVSAPAEGIDANGDIVGFATDTTGNTHPILWTPSSPTPEPASLCLLAAGTAILTLRRKSPRF